MEGQGVAASSASAAGGQGEPGSGAVAAAEFGHPADTYVTSDIKGGGEGQGRNGDDNHVMAAPGHPEASSQDAGMSPVPDSSPHTDTPQAPDSSQHADTPQVPDSSPDVGVPQVPDSSPSPRPLGEERSSRESAGQSSQESQAEFPSQQIKSDKADNVG